MICQAVSRSLGCGGTGIILLGSTPRRWTASACSGVCWAMIVKGWFGGPGRVASLQVRLPRSWSTVRRLWAGRPVSAVLVATFRFARSETSAFCTGVSRWAASPSGVVVLDQHWRQALAKVTSEIVGRYAQGASRCSPCAPRPAVLGAPGTTAARRCSNRNSLSSNSPPGRTVGVSNSGLQRHLLYTMT